LHFKCKYIDKIRLNYRQFMPIWSHKLVSTGFKPKKMANRSFPTCHTALQHLMFLATGFPVVVPIRRFLPKLGAASFLAALLFEYIARPSSELQPEFGFVSRLAAVSQQNYF